MCPPVRATTVLVRLKDTSQRPLIVPTGNPRDQTAAQPFEIYVRQDAGPWQRAKWAWDPYCERSAPEDSQEAAFRAGLVREPEADRPLVTLQPGEHALAFVRGCYQQDNGEPKEFKVVLRRPAEGGPGPWTGVLETPSQPAGNRLEQPTALLGALPMPEHFPAFNHASTGDNLGWESRVADLWDANRELFDLLPVYDPAAVAKEFDRRMRAEKSLPMKLLLAAVAARAGSEEAALFLLEAMKDTDYQSCVNVHGGARDIVSLFSRQTARLGRSTVLGGPDRQSLCDGAGKDELGTGDLFHRGDVRGQRLGVLALQLEMHRGRAAADRSAEKGPI